MVALRNQGSLLVERYANNLVEDLLSFSRASDGPPSEARGAVGLNEALERLKDTASGSIDFRSLDDLACAAKPVDSNRMSLPEAAGVVDPSLILTGSKLEQFKRMPEDIPMYDVPPPSTKTCHKIVPGHEVSIYRKMLSCGMAVVLPASDVVRDKAGKVVCGGLFAVKHKPDTDRVILDRRAFNMHEHSLSWSALPHGSQLIQIVLKSSQQVRGSGDDLSNYFYVLIIDFFLPMLV